MLGTITGGAGKMAAQRETPSLQSPKRRSHSGKTTGSGARQTKFESWTSFLHDLTNLSFTQLSPSVKRGSFLKVIAGIK